jgi:hypothetical protein
MGLNSAQRLRLAEQAHRWAHDIDKLTCAQTTSPNLESNEMEMP